MTFRFRPGFGMNMIWNEYDLEFGISDLGFIMILDIRCWIWDLLNTFYFQLLTFNF